MKNIKKPAFHARTTGDFLNYNHSETYNNKVYRNCKKSFVDHDLLPTPASYYSNQFPNLNIKSEWVKVLCPFHDDHTPSLNINTAFGGYRCWACGAKGGDVLAFQMQRYSQTFKEAAIALNAWRQL